MKLEKVLMKVWKKCLDSSSQQRIMLPTDGVMFQIMNATRENAELQQKYNDKQQYYYYEYYEESPDEYMAVMEILENEHEYELQNLNSWEAQLEMDKNNYETRLNEITTFESSWTKLLQTNIKNDFTYGGAGK